MKRELHNIENPHVENLMDFGGLHLFFRPNDMSTEHILVVRIS